jgi:hypothetical protein
MEGFFEAIVNKISNPLILAVLLMFSTTLYFLRKGINNFISNISPKDLFRKRKTLYKIKDLCNHDLFNELEIAKLYSFKFDTDGQEDITKGLVFKDFIDVKLSSTSKNMLKISQEATSEMTKQELKAHVNNCFNDCNNCLGETLKKVFIEKGLDKKSAELVLMKFFLIRSKALKRYNKRIESIFACDFYENNFQLILALYEVIAYEIDDIISASYETFIEINGMFYGLEYK